MNKRSCGRVRDAPAKSEASRHKTCRTRLRASRFCRAKISTPGLSISRRAEVKRKREWASWLAFACPGLSLHDGAMHIAGVTRGGWKKRNLATPRFPVRGRAKAGRSLTLLARQILLTLSVEAADSSRASVDQFRRPPPRGRERERSSNCLLATERTMRARGVCTVCTAICTETGRGSCQVLLGTRGRAHCRRTG